MKLKYLDKSVPQGQAQKCQCEINATQLGFTGAVPGSGNLVSNVIQGDGYASLAYGMKSSQAGSISVQRYLDAAGTIPVGAAVTATLVANTAQWLTINDGLVYQSVIVTVANSSGTPANITNALLLFQA